MRNPLTRVVGSYECFPWWVGAAWRMDNHLAYRAIVLPFHIPARLFRWAWWWLKRPWRKTAHFERVAQLEHQIAAIESQRQARLVFHAQEAKQSYAAGWRAGYANAYDVMGAMVDKSMKTEGQMLEAGRAVLKRPGA